MTQFEVEQKFHVDSLSAIESQLVSFGAARGSAVSQVDTYFAHPGRDFAKTDEAFRLRRLDNRGLVTYKGPRLAGNVKTRREIEIPLGDGENVPSLFREMVVALGFEPVADVAKKRQYFSLMWEGLQVECALDDVALVGPFVELEIVAEEDDLKRCESAILTLAAKMGLEQVETRSYLEMRLARG